MRTEQQATRFWSNNFSPKKLVSPNKKPCVSANERTTKGKILSKFFRRASTTQSDFLNDTTICISQEDWPVQSPTRGSFVSSISSNSDGDDSLWTTPDRTPPPSPPRLSQPSTISQKMPSTATLSTLGLEQEDDLEAFFALQKQRECDKPTTPTTTPPPTRKYVPPLPPPMDFALNHNAADKSIPIWEPPVTKANSTTPSNKAPPAVAHKADDEDDEGARKPAPALLFEVMPGYSVPLRGRQGETMAYIRQGKSIVAQECMDCRGQVHCVGDAEMVLCPFCRVAQPIVCSTETRRHGLALGFGLQDFVEMAEECSPCSFSEYK